MLQYEKYRKRNLQIQSIIIECFLRLAAGLDTCNLPFIRLLKCVPNLRGGGQTGLK